jgi:hypothetical protein
MNEFMAKFWFYLWLCLVVAVGGVVSILNKVDMKGLTREQKARKIAACLLTSMFVGYIAYEIVIWGVGNERLAAALAGVASYMSTDALVALGNLFISIATKGKGER